MSYQHIQEDSTQSVLTYPPQQFQGVPSSVTVRVETPAQSMQLAADAEAATVDSVSATTNAAALAGALTLSFASDPTATADNLYLITDATTGAQFRVKCRKTGTTFHLWEALPMALGSASTISGIAITHALTATETRDSGQGNTIVNATVNGDAIEWFHAFRVVSRQVGYKLNASRLTQLEPDISRHRPNGDPDWQETIEAAWVKFVYPDLARRGFRPERIVSWDLISPWHASACMVHCVATNSSVDTEDREAAIKMMHMHGENAIQSVDAWYDASDSAGPDGPPEVVRQMSSPVTR